MTRTLTRAAQCAKAIRAELKAEGIHASVTSSNFAGGNSVSITLVDVTPATHAKVKGIVAKYEYGHYNGQEDIYEYSNTRDDIPQAKYVQVEHHMSAAKREEVYQFIRKTFDGGQELPATYELGRNAYLNSEHISQLVWQQWCRVDTNYWAEKLGKVVSLTCCCCGNGTRGRQWHNRDTGYGLCDDCVDYCHRGVNDVEFKSCYGEKGVHYAVQA